MDKTNLRRLLSEIAAEEAEEYKRELKERCEREKEEREKKEEEQQEKNDRIARLLSWVQEQPRSQPTLAYGVLMRWPGSNGSNIFIASWDLPVKDEEKDFILSLQEAKTKLSIRFGGRRIGGPLTAVRNELRTVQLEVPRAHSLVFRYAHEREGFHLVCDKVQEAGIVTLMYISFLGHDTLRELVDINRQLDSAGRQTDGLGYNTQITSGLQKLIGAVLRWKSEREKDNETDLSANPLYAEADALAFEFLQESLIDLMQRILAACEDKLQQIEKAEEFALRYPSPLAALVDMTNEE